jgi:DNA-binding response OmpR family regulator
VDTGVTRLAPASRGLERAFASLLIVSDVGPWADGVAAGLAVEGFHVERDATGEIAFDAPFLATVDAAVVDLRLRHQSGLAVCAAVRARGHRPILAMGPTGDEGALLAALAAGADQYTPVDTSVRLLVARLRALLRRFPPPTAGGGEDPPADLAIDDVLGVVVVGGVTVRLSVDEIHVLRALVARPGCVVPRRSLVGPWGDLGAERRLDRVIRRLRHKLEAADGRRRIRAVRGVGFRYEGDDAG